MAADLALSGDCRLSQLQTTRGSAHTSFTHCWKRTRTIHRMKTTIKEKKKKLAWSKWTWDIRLCWAVYSKQSRWPCQDRGSHTVSLAANTLSHPRHLQATFVNLNPWGNVKPYNLSSTLPLPDLSSVSSNWYPLTALSMGALSHTLQLTASTWLLGKPKCLKNVWKSTLSAAFLQSDRLSFPLQLLCWQKLRLTHWMS